MNKKDKFTYKIIETAVSKAIKHIEEHGNRGVRYIVDLGEYFSTGRNQKSFFETAAKLLADEDSKYYKLAKEIVSTVDHKILKKFGINLGYNSWTYGAKLIRQNEKEFGYKIPWSMVFDFQNPTYNLTSSDLSDFLYLCESTGIFCCHFFAGNNINRLSEIVQVLKEHDEGSYFLFLDCDAITDEVAETISQAANIAVVLLYECGKTNSQYEIAAKKLSAKKCIFGMYSTYNRDNFNSILNKENLSEIQKRCQTFMYFIQQEPLSESLSSTFAKDINLINAQNEYSIYFIDFHEQLTYVDNVISQEDNIITINGKGEIYALIKENIHDLNLNIKSNTILEILKNVDDLTHT